MYGELHPKSDVGRLYILRKDGEKGFIAIEDCVELAVWGLKVYFHGSEKKLIQVASGDRAHGLDAGNILKKVKKEKKLQDWEN